MKEKIQSHKDLLVWKRSIDLAKNIYQITKTFPKEELYGITAQIRKSAVSVASNIAEGAAKGTSREYARFLNISLGSLAELETQLIIAERIEYLKDTELLTEIETIRKMLIGLIRKKFNK